MCSRKTELGFPAGIEYSARFCAEFGIFDKAIPSNKNDFSFPLKTLDRITTFQIENSDISNYIVARIRFA